MRRVVVVSRTKMNTLVCVGSLDVDNLESLRLLDAEGNNLPADVGYEIGQVWKIEGYRPQNIEPPHVEDYCVTNQRLLKTIDKHVLRDFVLQRLNVWRGGIDQLYNGCLRVTTHGSGYITRQCVPDRSTWFWLPDAPLRLVKGESRYYFYSSRQRYLRLKHVGFEPVTDELPRGTLLRLSLARWWDNDADDLDERCYLQLSGWY
jgi:hypothetical protein